MNRLIFLFCFLISCTPKLIENNSVDLSTQSYTNIGLDVLGQTYMYSEVELIKNSIMQDTTWSFSSKGTESLSHVSFSNPNKLTIFVKDSQELWILDSTLSLVEEIDLVKFDKGDIGFATRLIDNRILLYSRSQRQLYKYNHNRNVIYETDVLWDLEGEVIDLVQSDDQYVLLTDTGQLLLFDDYGNFMQELKLGIGGSPISLANNRLYYFQEEAGDIRYVNLNDPIAEEQKLTLQLEEGIDDFVIGPGKIYFLKDSEIFKKSFQFKR